MPSRIWHGMTLAGGDKPRPYERNWRRDAQCRGGVYPLPQTGANIRSRATGNPRPYDPSVVNSDSLPCSAG